MQQRRAVNTRTPECSGVGSEAVKTQSILILQPAILAMKTSTSEDLSTSEQEVKMFMRWGKILECKQKSHKHKHVETHLDSDILYGCFTTTGLHFYGCSS